MSKFFLKTLRVVLGFAVGGVAVVSISGCTKVQPAVAKVSPEEARPGATLTIAGKGLSDQVVKVGEVVAQVKSRAADSILVVELPKTLKPGSYDLVVTDQGTKISSKPVTSKPVKVRILDVVTVPAGTALRVRTVEGISSGQNHVNDTFLLALDQPMVVDGRTVAGEGSEVRGRVIQVEDAGRVKGRAEIGFTLVQLKADVRTYSIATGNALSQAQSTKGKDAMTIGAGAGIGAAIGGIFGGKKGAVIGAGAGGAAGTGAVLATRGKEVEIPSGTRFSFILSQPIEIQMTGVLAKAR